MLDSIARLDRHERLLARWLPNEQPDHYDDQRPAWHDIARPEQRIPDGLWRSWLLLAGRGWGKTHTGAATVNELAMAEPGSRWALVGRSTADVRDVMVEGGSGICTLYPEVHYEPSKRRLTWPNGSIATTYTSETPDQLRGPEHDGAWCDELASWIYLERTWDMLQLGLRLGQNPRTIITTTPRPLQLLRQLREDDSCVVTVGRTHDNAANLAPSFLDAIEQRYRGTRLWAQEVEARILDDAKGALWNRRQLEQLRVVSAPKLRRVVVAIDPAATSKKSSDETGVIVVGMGDDGQGYVLADYSGRYSPDGWANAALSAYDTHKANMVVAEVNNGGEMVGHVLRTKRPSLPYRAIHASRGKRARAEPVAALYEQSKVRHVGPLLSELEDQMCSWDGTDGSASPDRVDAVVWALTELMHTAAPGVYSSGERRRRRLPQRCM